MPRWYVRDYGARHRRKIFRKFRRQKSDRSYKGYCNELEYRMAQLLIRNGIKFQYSKRFETINLSRNGFGRSNHREVDFWLYEPTMFYGYDFAIQAIEVKSGKFDKACRRQQAELRRAGIYTFIVTLAHVLYWEYHGLLQ